MDLCRSCKAADSPLPLHLGKLKSRVMGNTSSSLPRDELLGLFDKVDANRSGTLDTQEVAVLCQLIWEREGQRSKLPPSIGEKVFTLLDSDGDGVITHDEFEALVEEVYNDRKSIADEGGAQLDPESSWLGFLGVASMFGDPSPKPVEEDDPEQILKDQQAKAKEQRKREKAERKKKMEEEAIKQEMEEAAKESDDEDDQDIRASAPSEDGEEEEYQEAKEERRKKKDTPQRRSRRESSLKEELPGSVIQLSTPAVAGPDTGWFTGWFAPDATPPSEAAPASPTPTKPPQQPSKQTEPSSSFWSQFTAPSSSVEQSQPATAEPLQNPIRMVPLSQFLSSPVPLTALAAEFGVQNHRDRQRFVRIRPWPSEVSPAWESYAPFRDRRGNDGRPF